MNSLERRTAKLNSGSGSGQGKARLRTLRRRVLTRILLAGSSVLLLAVLAFAMTAAWFTNVTRSSDLTFTVESWGFDESRITVPEGAVTVAPGRSGVIPLRVTNSGSSSRVRLDVGVSRGEDMHPELQKRLYFYVDASAAVNGETLDRLYITDREGERQTYYLGPGAVLDIAEDYQTDQPIRWSWVYDLLGYYFLGNPEGVEEYLRPIEYDFDAAAYDEAGELLSLENGTRGRTEFLAELFARDGYPGSTVTPVTVSGKTYYPVQVDGTGHGVWAYLLTKEEILAGFDADSQASQWGDARVNVHIIAYDMPASVTRVGDEEALAAALAAPEGGVVALEEDLTLASPAAVQAGSSLVLDLDGHNLTYSGSGAAFSVPDGGSLTLLNGQADLGGATAVESKGGDVTLSGLTVTNCATAVLVRDDEAAGDSILRITDCALTSTESTVWVYANSATAADTRVYITNSTLDSGYAALLTNGSYGGTEMVVQQSALSGYWAGLYQPQKDAYTVLRESTVTGYTGAAVKGGVLIVENSVVSGTGAANAPAPGGSGWTDTGDGVYVEANYGWSARVELRGADTAVSSADGYAVQLFGVEGRGPGRIMLYDGTYTGALGGTVSNGVGVFEVHGSQVVPGANVADKRDQEGGGAGG